MWPIIIFVVILLLTTIILIHSVTEKSFLSKKNLIFFVPLLLVLYGIYHLGYVYAGNNLTGLSFFECMTAALKAFKLEVVKSYLEPLMNDNLFFKIDVYIAIPIAGLTHISGFLGFFKTGIINMFKVLKKSHSKSVDIVFGNMETCVQYAKNYKDTVVWVDPRFNKLTQEDRKKLYEQGITFIYRVLNAFRLKTFNLFARNHVHIICFEKSNERLSDIYGLIDKLSNSKKYPYQFYVQSDGEYLSFIDEQLSKHCEKVKNVTASSFDIYELMSRRFASKHNLAKYLPREFIENGTVKDEYNINVVMLGFGKTSYSLLKSIILNNQFVTIKNNKFETKPINFYLYDKEKDALSRPLLTYFEMYKSSGLNELNKVELPCVIFRDRLNVKCDYKEDFLKRFISKENEFTYYFICTRDDIENAAIADSLSRVVDLNRSVIFYNVDSKKSELQFEEKTVKEKHIIPIGYKNAVLSHELITNDELWYLSNLHNENYNHSKNEVDISLASKPVIERLSNAYAAINYEFKLNMLGYGFDISGQESVNEEEFMRVYDPQNKRVNIRYNDYFEINTRTAIAYQEHLRWSIFYLIHGYRPMPFSEIRFDTEKNRIIHKNIHDKKHACLVDYYELDNLIKYEYSLLPETFNGHKKCIDDVDSYKFDYQSIDNIYRSLSNLKYHIKKL